MPEITDPTSRLIASRIRAKRIEREWTLTTLSLEVENASSAAVTLAPGLLGRIEGCTRALSLPELDAIAVALGVAVDWLTRAGELCTTCGQEISR